MNNNENINLVRRFSFKETSTAIDNIIYYIDEMRLTVEFKGGRLYNYSPVSTELYHGLFLAPSVGKFIREKIIINKDITCTQVLVETPINNILK